MLALLELGSHRREGFLENLLQRSQVLGFRSRHLEVHQAHSVMVFERQGLQSHSVDYHPVQHECTSLLLACPS